MWFFKRQKPPEPPAPEPELAKPLVDLSKERIKRLILAELDAGPWTRQSSNSIVWAYGSVKFTIEVHRGFYPANSVYGWWTAVIGTSIVRAELTTAECQKVLDCRAKWAQDAADEARDIVYAALFGENK